MPPPLSSYELIERAHRITSDFAAEMRTCVAELPGNPGAVRVRRFGSAWATACDLPGAPEWMQLVAPLDADDVALLPNMVAWYRGRPFLVEPTPSSTYAALAASLAAHGGQQTSFLDILFGAVTPPATCPGSPPEHATMAAPAATSATHRGDVEVSLVDGGEADLFARTLLDGHGGAFSASELEGLARHVGSEGLRCYLARVTGEPAAAAMLRVNDDVAYLANASTLAAQRERGCHNALLRARLGDAAAAGCQTVVGLAAVASTSHRNMERAGLHTLVTVARWAFPGGG